MTLTLMRIWRKMTIDWLVGIVIWTIDWRNHIAGVQLDDTWPITSFKCTFFILPLKCSINVSINNKHRNVLYVLLIF